MINVTLYKLYSGVYDVDIYDGDNLIGRVVIANEESNWYAYETKPNNCVGKRFGTATSKANILKLIGNKVRDAKMAGLILGGVK